jgi:hypothetical protein
MTSRPGVGSTFGFAVPRRHPDAPALHAPLRPRPAEDEAPGTERGVETVLLVEDDRHSADLLTVYLEGAG